MKLAAAILLLISIVFIGVAAWGIQKAEFLKQNGVRTTAVVARLAHERNAGMENSEIGVYYPIFTFTLKDGSEKTLRSNNGSNPPEFKEGDRVELLYDEKAPENFTVDNWWGLYLLPTVFGAVAALLLLIALGMSVIPWRRLQGQKQDLKHQNNIFDRDSRR